jgi:tetratricopeptide (TPR) repeat protein
VSRPPNFDLFVSYSREDEQRGQISEIVARIEKEYRDFTGGGELRVCFDKSELVDVGGCRQHTLEALRSSRLLLVCLSPNYLHSEYCSWELNQYLRQKAAHISVAQSIGPIYFVEVLNGDDEDFEQHAARWVAELQLRECFDFLPWFEDGAAELEELAVKNLQKSAEVQIQRALERTGLVVDIKGNLDRRNEHFVGRTAELRRLREVVAGGQAGVLTIINGPDGIGKTALAIEYGYLFAHEYVAGCWQVMCGNREDLRVALASLAGVRDLDFNFTEEEKRDPDLSLNRVLSELKRRSELTRSNRVLLLLDNVDQPKLLHPDQVRQLSGVDWLRIIVTTKFEEYELFGKQKDRVFVRLRELPEGQALGLIERYQTGGKFVSGTTCAAGLGIVRSLGGFTLGVEHAAIFLSQSASNQDFVSFHDNLIGAGLTSFEEIANETFDDGSSLFKRCLNAALRPTLEILNETERETLLYASLLPSDHVALPWLRSLVAQTVPGLSEDRSVGSSGRWLAVLQRLFSLRLLQTTNEHSEARMHPLVQEVIKQQAGAETVSICEHVLRAHVKARSEFLWEGWVRHEYRWEIVPLIASASELLDRKEDQGAYLANQVFGPLRNLGKFGEAEELLRRALTFDERTFGLNHPNVATCLNNLAALLHETNRLEEAEILYRRALAIDEHCFGSNDPKVATCLNNLAALLHDTDRLKEAEILYRRALAVDEHSFGPNHPRVATHLNNLAQLLRASDRPDEAEPLYRRALAIDQEVLGPSHPRIAGHLNNLAQLLHSLNRLGEAESLYRRGLAIDEQSFGLEHPRVATHLNNLATLLKAAGRLREAEPLFRRALAIDEQNFGSDHPSVGTDLNNLAALLEQTNRFEEAEQLMQRVLRIFVRYSASSEHEHPFLQTAIRNYAALLAEMGRSSTQILARFNDLAHRFGGGSYALSELPLNSDERQRLSSMAAINKYRAGLRSFFRRIGSFFGLTGKRDSTK